MSVVINTNFAATIASNNLANSSQMLQKSLNRLSSGTKIVNPADDAGGLAVSMKLSATAKRQGAVNSNIANTVSLLQTQDGVLKVSGAILNRISELKVLNGDITKSSSDRANYQTEFAALQAQLTANGGEQFNGISLFGTNSLAVGTTESGGATVTTQGVPLLGTAGFSPFSDNFANLSNWTTSVLGGLGGPSVTASGNKLLLNDATGAITSATSNQTFSGAFDVTVDFQHGGGGSISTIGHGSDTVFSYLADTNPHSLRISFDGAGNATSYLDGSSTAYSTASGISVAAGGIKFTNVGGIGSVTQVQNFAVTSTSITGNVAAVTAAGSLGSLSLSSVTSAISDIATYRAQNGASQSRFGYASELLAVNKGNLEAATSRIIDVDVAEESTQLARYNMLVQAGTAMLSQANQSTQMALKLLG